jgi:hypothetical protein
MIVVRTITAVMATINLTNARLLKQLLTKITKVMSQKDFIQVSALMLTRIQATASLFTKKALDLAPFVKMR